MNPKEKAIRYANLYPQFQKLPYDIMEHILDIALEEQAKEHKAKLRNLKNHIDKLMNNYDMRRCVKDEKIN